MNRHAERSTTDRTSRSGGNNGRRWLWLAFSGAALLFAAGAYQLTAGAPDAPAGTGARPYFGGAALIAMGVLVCGFAARRIRNARRERILREFSSRLGP